VSFRVELLASALEDLDRLYAFIIEREFAGGGRAEAAQTALDNIMDGLAQLRKYPHTCRKAASSPYLRELVIRFGDTGCVALFEIVSEHDVNVTAIRHQREDDYH
jgi:plasmid stabilization system protein ParE